MAGGRRRLTPEEKRVREQERKKQKKRCVCGKLLGKTQLWVHKNVLKCTPPNHSPQTSTSPSAMRTSLEATIHQTARSTPSLDEDIPIIAEDAAGVNLQEDPSMDIDIEPSGPGFADIGTARITDPFIATQSSPEPMATGGPAYGSESAHLHQSTADGTTSNVVHPEPGSLDDIALRDACDSPGDVHASLSESLPQEPEAEIAEPTTIHLDDLKTTQEFIEALRCATLANDQLHADLRHRLHNPHTSELQLEDPIVAQSLDTYLEDITEQTYENLRASFQRRSGITMLSHARIKAKVQEISGVYPNYNDMCIKGCLAFVGPFAAYIRCPKCGEDRYDSYLLASKGVKKPRQQFVTIPLGPQVQAAYRSAESAADMHYRAECTRAVMADVKAGKGISEWADYIHGTSYLEAVEAGDIDETTTVLLGSLDGAQLYRMKASDCWIYIWVLLDRAPGSRYKKKHVLIGGVIPGPDKPGHIDSFLFPGLHHLSALMHDGFKIWDARRNTIFISRPFLAFMTADGPGMAEVNGLVGHSGAQGCRLYCGMKGRRKPDTGRYYPVSLKPRNYEVEGCSHDDIALEKITAPGSQNDVIDRYEQNLRTLLSSTSQAAYRQNRLATGISKPSLISGLPPSCICSVPGCFPGDLMHLCALNLPDILLSLWRGKIPCDHHLGDNKATWDWAALQDGPLWERHGEQVAAATPYLPGSFDRPPRNPAEKLTSGYKAMEFLTYIYGLGPGLLYGVLPMPYWKSFCKLVRGVRIVHQKTINGEELTEADRLLLEFCVEFEQLYYQRDPARIHFVRQSIHALSHLASETTRIGPYAGVAQWTMENAIGNLTREINQHSSPYANLGQRAVRRCQVNALKAMLPELDQPKPLPKGAEDLGNGYVLLPKREKSPCCVTESEAVALRDFVLRKHIPASTEWLANPVVSRWARLRLPTGQVARSYWQEQGKPLTKLRMSRNIKLSHDGETAFAEVKYYFKLQTAADTQERVFAMVDFFGAPDAELLKESSNTLWSCSRQEEGVGLHVVEIDNIHAVVAMVPHSPLGNVTPDNFVGRVFVVKKLGLDVMSLAGVSEDVDEE